MSRTDKDNPWWVRAEYYEPYHYCGWRRRGLFEKVEKETDWGFKYTVSKLVSYKWEYVGDCELPETPVRQHPNIVRRINRTHRRCGWSPEWVWDRRMQTRGVRKKFWRHAEYHGPQRMNERLAAREVVKGNHEYEFPDGRTRHSVLWDMS